MEAKKYNLKNSMRLKKVSTEDAKQAFEENKKVYAEVKEDYWMVMNKKLDLVFNTLFDDTQFYLEDEDECDTIIITKTRNVAEYFKSKGVKGKEMALARPCDIKGKTVFGTMPIHMMDMAKEVYMVSLNMRDQSVPFESIPYEQFDSLGAVVRRYEVNSEIINMDGELPWTK